MTLTDDFLLSLLEERITNKYEILTRQDLYNMKFYKYLYVISINFIGSHNSNDIISFTLQRIKSYFPNNSALWVNYVLYRPLRLQRGKHRRGPPTGPPDSPRFRKAQLYRQHQHRLPGAL